MAASPVLSVTNVRVGSISEVGPRKRHVRFRPVSDQTADIAGGSVRAITRPSRNSPAVQQYGRPRRDASFGGRELIVASL
jgi:hypothetical protein